MPLQTIYRPASFDDFYGNEEMKEMLLSVLSRKNDVPHAFLFHGPAGCGKTTICRIVATHIGCHQRDIHEYNTSNTRGIDTIREISDLSIYLPLYGDRKFFLMDEAHKLTDDAQNALLKLLEEPPSYVFFGLCTTDPKKLKVTVRERCHDYLLKPISDKQVVGMIQDVLSSEGVTEFPESVISKIVVLAEGVPRKALRILDKIIDVTDLKKAEDFLVAEENSIEGIEICRLLVSAKDDNKWNKMKHLLANCGSEPEDLRYAILGYFRAILLKKKDDRLHHMMTIFLDSVMYSGRGGILWQIYEACKL